MLSTLRDISVKVASEEEMTEQAEQPEMKTELPPVEEPDRTPGSTGEVVPDEVPDTPSESNSDESNVIDTPMSRSLKQEGSSSEYGTETDDEGVVVVGRQHH